MRTELIRIPTPTAALDGLYYTPDGPAQGSAVYFHGNQMNFYVCAARFLAPVITCLGYAFLAFNRRGHDSVSTGDSREPVGGAFQTVSEGAEDNEIAAEFMATKGFEHPVVPHARIMRVRNLEMRVSETRNRRAWLVIAPSVALAWLCASCGPAGVTLLKPSDLVNYQYVTCYPHKDDPGGLEECIRYYEKRGFVQQDQINLLQM